MRERYGSNGGGGEICGRVGWAGDPGPRASSVPSIITGTAAQRLLNLPNAATSQPRCSVCQRLRRATQERERRVAARAFHRSRCFFSGKRGACAQKRRASSSDIVASARKGKFRVAIDRFLPPKLWLPPSSAHQRRTAGRTLAGRWASTLCQRFAQRHRTVASHLSDATMPAHQQWLSLATTTPCRRAGERPNRLPDEFSFVANYHSFKKKNPANYGAAWRCRYLKDLPAGRQSPGMERCLKNLL